MTTADRLARLRKQAEERRAHRAAMKATLADRKAEKARLSKTCQCCGRAIFAETGTIAHHGYERPGSGWQTASCMGAKYLPFEVSRDRLGFLIVAIENRIEGLKESLAKVQAESVPFRFEYSTRQPVGSFSSKHIERWVEVTRSTFWDVREAYDREMNRRMVRTFDDIKNHTVHTLQTMIERNEQYRREQQARYDGWKQTHKWDGDGWVAL